MLEDILKKLSQTTWHGHALLEIFIALGVCLGVAVVTRLLRGVITAHLRKVSERTRTKLDDAWVKVFDSTAWFFYLALGVLASSFFIDLSRSVDEKVSTILYILVGIQAVLWIQSGIVAFFDVWAAREGTGHAQTAAAAARFTSRLVLWTVLLLVVLGNLGVKLTTIVAGLGVGGVAAALAVQKVLGDLMAGLSMFFDRPFDIGDFIIVGDVMGNVTKVGLRTTRIDSLGGEKIVYPNGEIVTQYIRNYQRMLERRIVFHFRIEYGLSTKKIQQARDIAEEVVKSVPNVRFDRAHFHRFGEYALEFEVVYYVLSRDYNQYMDVQQLINMRLYEQFEDAQIAFAFPIQNIFHRSTLRTVQEGQDDARAAE